jgi:hypothetical protein
MLHLFVDCNPHRISQKHRVSYAIMLYRITFLRHFWISSAFIHHVFRAWIALTFFSDSIVWIARYRWQSKVIIPKCILTHTPSALKCITIRTTQISLVFNWLACPINVIGWWLSSFLVFGLQAETTKLRSYWSRTATSATSNGLWLAPLERKQASWLL